MSDIVNDIMRKPVHEMTEDEFVIYLAEIRHAMDNMTQDDWFRELDQVARNVGVTPPEEKDDKAQS